MTQPISTWALADALDLTRSRSLGARITLDAFVGEIHAGSTSAWCLLSRDENPAIALRFGYSPGGVLEVEETDGNDGGVSLRIRSELGAFTATIDALGGGLMRARTTFTPSSDLSITSWPRDLHMVGPEDALGSSGRIRLSQSGPRSGLVYATLESPPLGSYLYFHNLTELNGYFAATHTSGSDTVGGSWPTLGFGLPGSGDESLAAGAEVVIGDVFLALTADMPEDELHAGEMFLDLLADVYLAIPRPTTAYQDWLHVVDRSLADLEATEACWTEVDGARFVAAYVGDEETPPESMVQLAVLVPLLEMDQRDERADRIADELRTRLDDFFDADVGAMLRWHPGATDLLDDSEEHRQPRVMDSWYLYHPLINLSRLALGGDRSAEKLLLASLEYGIAVAQHFSYNWPVMFNVDTLDVVRAETGDGEGGEFDVGGSYALLMMQAFDLTGDDRYLAEAKRAADAMFERGFAIFYQLNDTCFASGAFLRLAQHTGEIRYRRLAELCLANVFAHAWLWECDYGYATGYPTFFSLLPLDGAPYVAAYEEIEAVGALEDYLERADEDIRPSLRLLIPEALKYLLNKAAFYYPTLLPDDAVADRPEVGIIVPHLWIPLEDLRDGWEESGQVGQEVYGAGSAFGLVSRHYRPAGDLVLHCEYPTSGFEVTLPRIRFDVLGDPRMSCRVRLVATDRAVPDAVLLYAGEKVAQGRPGERTAEGHLEWEVEPGRRVTVKVTGD